MLENCYQALYTGVLMKAVNFQPHKKRRVVTFHVKLVRKVQITADCWTFHFNKPKSFKYVSGQYIKMYLDIKNPDLRGTTHYFTLSSSPTERYLKITTRILKSSFKIKLGSLPLNTRVKMRGPWGDFVLDESKKKSVVFLSGGMGVTPFRSMIKYATDINLNIQIILFASYKTPGEIIFNNEFTKTASMNRNIRIITTITKPEGTGWKGETGRIDPLILKRHIANLSDNVYYISGPETLVDAIEKMLKAEGLLPKQILTDGFPGY